MGLLFHFSIVIVHGLVSFFFATAGALILYLHPIDKAFNSQLFTRLPHNQVMLFKETQRLIHSKLFMIIGIPCTLFFGKVIITSLYAILIKNAAFEQHMIFFFLILIPIFIFLVVFFFGGKLTTLYDEKGITYQFFPFQWKFKHIAWSDIEKAYIRKYKPLLEYGGWGHQIWS